jgi:hypothetical protein
VEEMLAEYRRDHPQLRQLIFRPGTVLGEHTNNRITNLFHRKVLVGVTGTDTPFVFVWDQDVAEAVAKGILENRDGIYNLVGDGVVTFPQIAALTGAKFVQLRPAVMRLLIGILRKLGLVDYGPLHPIPPLHVQQKAQGGVRLYPHHGQQAGLRILSQPCNPPGIRPPSSPAARGRLAGPLRGT